MKTLIDAAVDVISNLPDTLQAALHRSTGAFATPDMVSPSPHMLEAAHLLVAAASLFEGALTINVWSTTADGAAKGKKLDSLTKVMNVTGSSRSPASTVDLILLPGHYYVAANASVVDGSLVINGATPEALSLPTVADMTTYIHTLAASVVASEAASRTATGARDATTALGSTGIGTGTARGGNTQPRRRRARRSSSDEDTAETDSTTTVPSVSSTDGGGSPRRGLAMATRSRASPSSRAATSAAAAAVSTVMRALVTARPGARTRAIAAATAPVPPAAPAAAGAAQ